MKKNLMISLIAISILNITGCGSANNENDILDTAGKSDTSDTYNPVVTLSDLDNMTDEEILSLGEVYIPEFSIPVNTKYLELELNETTITPLARFTEVGANEEASTWHGVDFISALRYMGIESFKSVTLEDGNGNTQTYEYELARYGMICYGKNGKNINSNEINVVLSGHEDDSLWVENVCKITVEQ